MAVEPAGPPAGFAAERRCPECNEQAVFSSGYWCFDCWARMSANREAKAGNDLLERRYRRLRAKAASGAYDDRQLDELATRLIRR